MDTQTQILEAAEKLLDASPDRDISTRAVCEAAGVAAPVLYRLFGDKKGLLSALVDYGFDRYLAGKRAVSYSDDPVRDLRVGWDNHIAFALAHPAVYRLMYSPGFDTVPSAAQEAFDLLREVLTRCATQGKLAVSPDAAAQAILSANIGVALSLVTQAETYHDPGLSTRVRDAIHARILVSPAHRPAEVPDGPAASLIALQLAALLRERPSSLSEPEQALLVHWLDIIGAEGQR
ncbi:TetR/AcrR family transcriptional regulator [Micromonospora sp. NPDC050397]|uniref:TetR/AcrR family transcriptional regulator n=1 Tax=Micromonospora sp. NPDC050397 TaxID=3364279 RepID=UPI003850C3B2